MPSPTALDLTGYKLTFDDEFNSFSSNGPSNYQNRGHTGTWDTTLSYGERKLNDEAELYSDPTVGANPFSVAGGVLDIHAAPAPDPSKTWGQTYTSGIITTNHSFSQLYGYFEMRAELPSGSGMWPAFWLLPQQHVWPPELDVLEAFGQTTTNAEGGAYSLHHGLQTSGAGSESGWGGTAGASLYTQYNTFGVDWEPHSITFYFNGVAYATAPTPSDYHQPMYMLVNLAVGGNWAGAPVGEAADFKVDYVRAYSRDGANPAVAQGLISSPDGRGHSFRGATDAKGKGPTGAADLPPLPATATVAVGLGNDTLALSMSGDAGTGGVQFIVSVDGVRIGGTQTVTASHASGQTQIFDIAGNFRPGAHAVSVELVGSPAPGRAVYISAATIDGATVSGLDTRASTAGVRSFSFQGPTSAPVVLGSGPHLLALSVSGDAWLGDAQFAVLIDGVQVGGVQTATAAHAAGASQTFDVRGDFTPGRHVAALKYLNDAWGGSPAADRNLYLDRASFDGSAVPGGTLALLRGGTQEVAFTAPGTPTAGSGPDTLILSVSEDAWQGDARFIVDVDGKAVGGVQTATAAHAAGRTQDFAFHGAFGTGAHQVSVDFLNDAWGGSALADRNLYVDGMAYDGSVVLHGSLALFQGGSQTLTVAANIGVRGPVTVPMTASVMPSAGPILAPAAPAPPPSPAPMFALTDTTSMVSSRSGGDAYCGPVASLQRQKVWAGPHGVAMAAMAPNVFMHGGQGDDALSAVGGVNVLDGGAGSNFLVGADGADTFFVDGRNGTTWSTVVGFHHGDALTVWGFQPGVSTTPWTASDGASGYRGATMHSELAGVGTGVTASVTFAGMALADLLSRTTTSLGNIGGVPYLNVAYTG